MIFADSRYADAKVYKAFIPRIEGKSVVVQREFPTASAKFYYYQVGNAERIESIAYTTLGSSNAWSIIMDFNPEISNPFNIPVGTILRIPYD